MIKQFEVSANGQVFDIYEADDAQGARDACAVDAGCTGEADMVASLGQPSDLVAVERTGPFEITGRFGYLNGSSAGREAVAEYQAARECGKGHAEAETIASNVLQRAGYNVNSKGGVSIFRAR